MTRAFYQLKRRLFLRDFKCSSEVKLLVTIGTICSLITMSLMSVENNLSQQQQPYKTTEQLFDAYKRRQKEFSTSQDGRNKGLQKLAGEEEKLKFIRKIRRKLSEQTKINSINTRKENNGTSYPLDFSRKAYYPWRKSTSPHCRPYTTHFTHGAPVTALASYPGSGNTWARYLLEAASGIFTGSVYNDMQLYINGYRGELENWSSGSTLVQKVHEYGDDLIRKFNGSAVVLLRNPYRAILSYHNFLFGGHKGYAPILNYRRKDWESFLHIQIKQWLLTTISWVDQSSKMEVVHYEHLHEDPSPTLRRVLGHFGLSTDEVRLQCIKNYMADNFKRNVEHFPADLKIFSSAIREKIDRAVRYVDNLLEVNNLTRIPLHLYDFYNNTPSGEIMRVDCPSPKSRLECDLEIDEMNKKRKIASSGTTPTSEKGDDLPRPDIIERLGESEFLSQLTDSFSNAFYSFTPDPVKAMVKSEGIRRFLQQPVTFKYGHETEKLSKEYTSLL